MATMGTPEIHLGSQAMNRLKVAAVLGFIVAGSGWFGAVSAASPATTAARPLAGLPTAESLIGSVPSERMPPGTMTDEQAAAFREWAAQKLGGVNAVADFIVDAVTEQRSGAILLTGHLESPLALNGRSTQCSFKVTMASGEAAADDLAPGTKVSVTGTLARNEPLSPVRGTVPVGATGRMGVTGWSPTAAFLEMQMVDGQSVIVERPPPPVVEKPKDPPKPPPALPPIKPVPEPPATSTTDPKAGTAPPAFFGAPVGEAEKIVYIVDRSGSMTDSIDYVKSELRRCLGELKEEKQFHIVFYSSGPPVEMPPRKLVPATEENKKKAFAFIEDVIAQGETIPTEALQRAFALQPDVIFLLTDGDFTERHTVPGLIARLNVGKAVKVNTIAFLYKNGEAELKEIAAQNGGLYKFVSDKDLEALRKDAPPVGTKK
jgi:hypothetical protein